MNASTPDTPLEYLLVTVGGLYPLDKLTTAYHSYSFSSTSLYDSMRYSFNASMPDTLSVPLEARGAPLEGRKAPLEA